MGRPRRPGGVGKRGRRGWERPAEEDSTVPLSRAGKSCQGAFWAPDGSDRLLVTCYDSAVRVWSGAGAGGGAPEELRQGHAWSRAGPAASPWPCPPRCLQRCLRMAMLWPSLGPEGRGGHRPCSLSSCSHSERGSLRLGSLQLWRSASRLTPAWDCVPRSCASSTTRRRAAGSCPSAPFGRLAHTLG